jgi:trans-aconitate methyltransferase
MTEKNVMSKNNWQAQYYDQTVNYVTRLGESILDLLMPQQDEMILDLGCGTGHLTDKIAQRGANVVGVDLSINMITEARRLYPNIDFRIENAENLQFGETFDAVFSNAALHWMKNPTAVSDSVYGALKPGGRYVAELGGEKNVFSITDSLYKALGEHEILKSQVFNPWYFPSVGEYTSILEKSGLTVTHVSYFERPTPLDDCPNGLEDWIKNFAGDFLESIDVEDQQKIINRTVELAKPTLFTDGQWYADYRRLRFLAIKKD